MAGYVYPGQRQNQQKNNQNEWEKMLAQARMAMMMDGQTALGMALGRLIRDGWLSYKANKEEQKLNDYRNRGEAGSNTPDLNASSQPNKYDFSGLNSISDMIAQPQIEKNPTESGGIVSTDFLPGRGNGYQFDGYNLIDNLSGRPEAYKRYQLWWGGF